MAAGFVPCDPGCPMQGSLMQQMHNLLGLVTSLATGAGIFLMASASTISTLARTGLILGGIIWSLTFVLMPEPALVEWRGFLQRSEEHTSELQSRENLVCRLLLETKSQQ